MKRSNTILLTFLFLLTSLLISTTSTYAQLVGGNTYPINGVENPPTSFNNLTSAVAYLTVNGVTGSGEVIMELASGYPGELAPVTIPVITGTSSTLSVTFRPATGTLINTTIAGAASPNQHAIKITGNYITLDGRAGGVGTGKDWVITCTGGTTSGLGQMAVRLDNTTNSMIGVNLRYLKMVGEAANTTGGVFQITGNTTNTISNITIEENYITSTADTSIRTRGYGITLASASNVGNTGIVVRNNEITDFYARGINHTGGFPGLQLYGNRFYHTKTITQPTTTEFSAIYFSSTASAGTAIYNNYIYLIQLTNGLTAANGLYLYNGNSTGSAIAVHNNRIQLGNAITATTFPIYGLRDNALSGSLFNIYYNSVLVDGDASAGSSNSAAFRKEVSNFINLKNNIFYNARTNSGGTGTHWGISVNNTTFTSINNNDYFADGTGGVLGTTTGLVAGNQTTLSGWKSVVLADVSSVSQNPNYVAGLKIDTVIPSQLEAGGTPVTSVTLDFEGDTRDASTPDIGADEFAGTPLDLVAPAITYTALINTSNTTSVSLTANITDVSGIDTAANSPRLYMKKGALGIYSNVNATTVVGSDYNFTFNYSLIGGVAVGDTVHYYVAAQDFYSNAGTSPSGGSGSNPPGTTPPATAAQYLIVNLPLSGSYTVGLAMFNKISGRDISFERSTRKRMVEVPDAINNINDERGNSGANSDLEVKSKLVEVEETTWIPVENGKPFIGDLYVKKVEHPEMNFPDGIEGVYSTITASVNDLNLRGVSGPVTFLLTDSSYSTGETFPITVSIANENLPTATNTVTFKPNTSVTSVITGNTAQWVFGLNGSDYITFDGSNTIGGTTRDLSIVNTYTGGTFNIVVALFHNGTKGATNNTVKNCIIKGSPTPTNSYGLFLNAGGGGFNNTSFINNKIQNSKTAIQFSGILGNTSNNGLISGNIIGDVTEPLKVGGVLSANTDNLVITNNEIFGEAAGNSSTSQYGILLSTGTTNAKVRKNLIHDFYYTGTGGFGCFGIRFGSDATTVTEISNNFISNIKSDGDATGLTYTPSGIYIATGGNINMFFNSVYMTGNTLGRGTLYNGRSSCVSVATGVTQLDIRNNAFQNSMGSYPGSTMANLTYGVYSESANTAYTDINYNDYFVNGVSPYVGYLGVDQVDLAAWKIATAKDLNSVSGSTAFSSENDLHIPNGSLTALESAGTPIAGITTDYDGQTRNVTKPDIGADEFNGINSTTALSGNYYVGIAGSGPGGSDPQFATLKEACDTLNTFNVSGNTTFYITSNLIEPTNSSIGIDPGAFTVTFKPYTGTVDTITFTQVADNVGVSGGLVLGTPTLTITSTTNYGLVTTENIIIDGSNTVDGTTRDLVFVTATGINGNTNPIRIIGDVNNCTIKNVTVQTNQSVSYGISITNRFFTPSSWTPDSIIIENCSVTNTFGNAAQGIAISNSGTPTTFPTGMIFRNNDVFARTRGIFLNYAGNTDVYNNKVRVNQTQSGSLSYGIWGFTIGDSLNITNIYNNQITLLSTANSGAGFGIIGIEAGSRGTYNIYNNMISGFTTTTATSNPNIILIGIRLQGALVKANVFHNSIYMPDLTLVPGTGTVLYSGLYVANGTNIVKNNIVHSDEINFPSYCIYRAGALGTLVSDYNDFFQADTIGNIGYWNTAATKTLASWQVASSLDANTLNVTAPFTTASDLHIADGTGTLLESAGTPIASVTTDIDGQARNLSTPDIGADEFAGMVPLNAPTDLIAVADTFRVSLSWTDNSTNELGFILERKNGDTLSVDPYVVIDSVSVNVVAYIDSGRTPFTTYTYRVKAYSGTGESLYSNEATTTTIIPVELTSFAASVGTDNQISVVWSTATELNNSGFNLERKLDGEWQKVAFIEGKGTTTEKTEYSFVDKFKYESFQGTIQYRLKQIDFDGTFSYSKVASVEVDFTPKEYTLFQNYPNPFNPSTTIKFALPFDSNVRIAVYNLLGEQVEVIFDQVKEVGYHNISWNASELASGVYIYTIEAKSLDGLQKFNSVKKMMLVK